MPKDEHVVAVTVADFAVRDLEKRVQWILLSTSLVNVVRFTPLKREITCNFGLIEYYVRLSKGSLAQPVEQLAFNQLVACSNHARPTIFSFMSCSKIQ